MGRKPQPTGESERSEERKSYNVSATDFIKVWQSSTSVQEVSEKLGMPVPIVHARASSYRKAGVRLKNFPKTHGRALDIEALNELIDKMERGEITVEDIDKRAPPARKRRSAKPKGPNK
jgi:hypothetical protein